MIIERSGATFSSIVGIGQKVQRAALETGERYLELNRGVNNVTNIDLSDVKCLIDFNSNEFQKYSPNAGKESLRKLILKEYFQPFNQANTHIDEVTITAGGMSGLDLIVQTLKISGIVFPEFHWGSYLKIATIRNKKYSFYKSLDDFNLDRIGEHNCIFICDPSNPTGKKQNDIELLAKIKQINDTGAIIVFDSPYRKLFYSDNDFFAQLSLLKNVIISESFSKWVGLPGLRLGFIYSSNKQFNDELAIRSLYSTNSVSSPSQMIVSQLLSMSKGREAINKFRNTTVINIQLNIRYLRDHGLLLEELYKDDIPMGIFAIINKTEDYLFSQRIGAVGMDKFVGGDKAYWQQYSRICVSVEHGLFKEFISKII